MSEGEPKAGWPATYNWAFDEKLVKPFIPNRVKRMQQAWHAWYKDCTVRTWVDPVKKNRTKKK